MKIIHALTCAALSLGIHFHARAESTKLAPDQPVVQLAILLDTSNSMDGLIAQAKTQLWNIVNEFATAKQDGKAPRVQVALYQYGNNGLSEKKGWVQQVVPLTDDLDKLSEQLFALKTNGGEEYCGWVIKDAVKDLEWDSSPKTYKAIFIAGNEPFTQGPVSYVTSCKAAIAKGIIVNTIHCGPEKEGIEGKWKDGAALADGRFLVINQDARIADIPAPQDKKIAGLIQEAKKPCVVAVNKWDLIKEKTTDKEKLKAVLQQIEVELFFISYAPVLLLSAKTGEALDRLFKTIEKVRTGAKQRITTGKLNRIIAEAMTAHPPGARSGKRLKILYGTQPEPKRFCSISVPEIVFFANDGKLIDETYHRYLENQVRQHVPYVGLPLKFHFRSREKRAGK